MRKPILCIVALIVSLTGLAVSTVFGCRPIERPSAAKLVSGAEFIVRATAVKYVREPRQDGIRYLNTPHDAEIEFRVEEVVKGKKVPETLILNGYLTDRDDHNDQPVPYNFVRPGGRGGSCFAYEYRKGAGFLLFLEKHDNKYSIFPQALGPVNEQLRSKDDEWLTWVRKNVKQLSN